MLHDSLRSYVPDTVVEEPPRPRSQPQRDEEEEVEMRVMLDGAWHRELDPDLTVCGLRFPLAGQHRTANKYDGDRCPGKLCPGCYFPSEIARAEAIDQVVEEERLAAVEAVDVTGWRDPIKPFSLGDEIDRRRKRTERIAALAKPATKKDSKP